jgi:hypothetical protein
MSNRQFKAPYRPEIDKSAILIVEGPALPQRASNDEATDHSDCHGSCATECFKLGEVEETLQ